MFKTAGSSWYLEWFATSASSHHLPAAVSAGRGSATRPVVVF